MKALDRSVETLGLGIVTSSVTFIKSANKSSIKLCLIPRGRSTVKNKEGRGYADCKSKMAGRTNDRELLALARTNKTPALQASN